MPTLASYLGGSGNQQGSPQGYTRWADIPDHIRNSPAMKNNMAKGGWSPNPSTSINLGQLFAQQPQQQAPTSFSRPEWSQFTGQQLQRQFPNPQQPQPGGIQPGGGNPVQPITPPQQLGPPPTTTSPFPTPPTPKIQGATQPPSPGASAYNAGFSGSGGGSQAFRSPTGVGSQYRMGQGGGTAGKTRWTYGLPT